MIEFLLLTCSREMPNSTRHSTVGPLWETCANAALTFSDRDFYFSISRVIFFTFFFQDL